MVDIKVLKFKDLTPEQQRLVTPVHPDQVAAVIASGTVRIVALVDGQFECPWVDNIKTSDEPGYQTPYSGHTCEQTSITRDALQKWLRVRFGPEGTVE